MVKFHNPLRGFLIILVISSIIFATLSLTKHVDADNIILAMGTIEVYDSDGVSPLTDYGFPLFSGGNMETALKVFFINNTGDKPVYVYWNISRSSIIWTARNPDLDKYDCYEDSTWKYSLGIHQHSSPPTDYWSPDNGTLFLGANEGIKLGLELHYTGEPNTAETFAMTLSFYATDEDSQDLVVVALEDLKTEINGLPSEAFRHSRFAEWQKKSLCRQIDKITDKIENDNYKWAIWKLKWLRFRIGRRILDHYRTSLVGKVDEIISIVESMT